MEVKLSETSRQRQTSMMQAASYGLLFWAIVQLAAGVLLQFWLLDVLKLVDPETTVNLSLLLILGFLISAPIYLNAALKANQNRSVTMEDRVKLDSKMACVWITMLISSVLTFCTGMYCLIRVIQIENNNIQPAMQQYRSDKDARIVTDKIQRFLRCCGDVSYTDWFDVNWHDDEHDEEGQPTNGERYTEDSVPKSCCTFESQCIHTGLIYSGTKNIHTRGCGLRSTKVMCLVLWAAGTVLIILTVLQLLLIVLVRYLQTSTRMAVRSGDVTAPAPGWIWGRGPLEARGAGASFSTAAVACKYRHLLQRVVRWNVAKSDWDEHSVDSYCSSVLPSETSRLIPTTASSVKTCSSSPAVLEPTSHTQIRLAVASQSP